MMLTSFRTCRNFVAACYCLLIPMICCANESDSSAKIATQTAYSSILQMMLGLGIVLVLIAVMAWLLKKFIVTQGASTGNLRVISAVAIGTKERVILVDVGETRLVLGVAPGYIVRLLKLPKPPQELQENDTYSKSFIAKMKEAMAKRRESQ